MNLGEYTYGNFQQAFVMLDEESEHALSKGKTRRERKKWAGDDFCLHKVLCARACMFAVLCCVHYCFDLSCFKEADALFGLMSFARRYWRKAVDRNTQTPVS